MHVPRRAILGGRTQRMFERQSRELNDARHSYGFEHPRLMAITYAERDESDTRRWRQGEDEHDGEEDNVNNNNADGNKQSSSKGDGQNERKQMKSREPMRLTQYASFGPITLDQRRLSDCCDAYFRFLVGHMHANLSLAHLIRILTFVETDLYQVQAKHIITHATIWLERIHAFLFLRTQHASTTKPYYDHTHANPFMPVPVSTPADSAHQYQWQRCQHQQHQQLPQQRHPRLQLHHSTSSSNHLRATSSFFQQRRNDEILSREDEQWSEAQIKKLEHAINQRMHVLLLTCIILAVKFLDDIPRGVKPFLKVFPEVNKREYLSLERGILLLLDFDLWIDLDEYETRLADIQQLL